MRLRRNSKLIGFLFMFSAVVILSTVFRILPRVTIHIGPSPVMTPGYIVSQRNNKLPLFSMIFAESGPQDLVSLPVSLNFNATFKRDRPRDGIGSLKLFEAANKSAITNMLNVHIWDEICGNKLSSLLHYPLFPQMPSRRRFIKSLKLLSYGLQYGARVFGYLKITTPGKYTLRISDGEGEIEVWISENRNSMKAKLTCHSKQREAKMALQNSLVYIEILLKQGLKSVERTLEWMRPGSSKFSIIENEFILPYFDDRGFTGKDVILQYIVLPGLPMHKKDAILENHNTAENRKRSTMYLLPYVDEQDTVGLFPTCPYDPSYIVRGKLQRYQGVWETHYSSIFPTDGSNMTVFLRSGEPQLIFGNDLLEESVARNIVAGVMMAFDKNLPGKYQLEDILNVERNVDPLKGSRYLVELSLVLVKTGERFRFSEYVYEPINKKTNLCYPDNFRWNKTATVNFILTVGNQGRWAKHFIDTVSKIYEATKDQNINVIIVDFDSHDLDLHQALEQSSIPRYTLLRKFGKFYKSEAIQQAANTILDPNSIVLQVDLHLTMPLDFVDNVRKHCVRGKMAFSPCVTRLVCGSYLERPIGFWEVVGYGIFGIYKQDWDIFGGMNIAEFRNRWGGEDWEMLDRVMMAGYEVERLKMLHFNHVFHTKKGMWENMN